MFNKYLEENNFLIISFFIFLIIIALIIPEFFSKKRHEEISRKIPHIIIGVILSISPIFMTKNEIIISAIILFFGVWIGKYSPFFKKIFSIKRISYGLWLTPLSLGIMSWIWLPEHKIPFILGMFILAFPDALAAILGRLYGKSKIPYTKKTFLGTGSFFLSTFIILTIFSKNFDLWNIFWISLLLSFFELILIFGLDNLFLPIISSFLFYWFLF